MWYVKQALCCRTRNVFTYKHFSIFLSFYRLFKDNLKAQNNNVKPWLKHLLLNLNQHPPSRLRHRRPLRLKKKLNPLL